MEGGGYVFFAKYTLNLPYFCLNFHPKKILFSYMIFVKSGLTPCAIFKNISALSWQSNG
jgi:hypothetical protein